MEILFLFFMCVGGCWLIAKIVGGIFFGQSEKRNTFVDRSVHHHYHQHHHDNKTISIIDDATKKKILELKDKK